MRSPPSLFNKAHTCEVTCSFLFFVESVGEKGIISGGLLFVDLGIFNNLCSGLLLKWFTRKLKRNG